MLEKNVTDIWCHRAIVAVQRGVTGRDQRLETIPVGYNRTTLAVNPLDDEVLGRHCTCIGSQCANWIPNPFNFLCYVPLIGYFWPKMGRCRG